MPEPAAAAQTDDYLLGNRHEEEQRLRRFPREIVSESRSFLERAGLRPGHHAVDFGCGPRGVLDILSEKAGPSGTVIGIERSAPTAELARQFVAESRLAAELQRHLDYPATLVVPDMFFQVAGRKPS